MFSCYVNIVGHDILNSGGVKWQQLCVLRFKSIWKEVFSKLNLEISLVVLLDSKW